MHQNSSIRIALRFGFLFLLCGATLSRTALGSTSKALPQPSGIVSGGPGEATDAQDDALYAKGSKAMDEQRWNDALTAFDQLANAKGKRADAGLYWKAYSLNKLHRKEEASAVCRQLREQYGSSAWNKECVVLQVRQEFDNAETMRVANATAFKAIQRDDIQLNLGYLQNWSSYQDLRGGKARAATDDDIKILALNSLMRQDPAKALPLLRAVIHSDKPIEVRKQALFVLSRSKDPQAVTILTEVATGKGDPGLQREAIQVLALNRGKEAGSTLVEVYRSSSDAGVKRAALSGLFMAHDASRLVDLARSEKDLNQKREIVEQLAMMRDPVATDYMLELLK